MQSLKKTDSKKFWKLFSNQVKYSVSKRKQDFSSMEAATEPVPQKQVVLDGNSIASYVAYAFSENSFIYPISPSSAMGDKMDQMAASQTKNMFGEVVDCLQMQSEGGAAGSMHGAIASGSLTSTFTASQGLLLMIPNMYLMAGERAPTVIHVASRTISKHALSIFNDHSDVMATRQTGFALLCSSRNQEVHDMAMVAHIATLRTGIPFLHFFDGWQTSHTYSNLELMDYADMRKLFPDEDLKKNLRDKQMTTVNPLSRGLGQRPDIFFQQNIANKRFYDEAPEIIEGVMRDVEKATGRPLGLFKWYGDEDATEGIVIMGSGANSCREVLEFLHKSEPNRKVGVLKVQLYRPWSPKHVLAQLPKTLTRLTVLDKTREEGSIGEPLYLDMVSTLTESDSHNHIKIFGGIYGLASKNFTPAMIISVFNNMQLEKPKNKFTIGIDDDVTNTSLDIVELEEPTIHPSIKQCINWGFGGDGSVGAMNSTVKLISEQTGSEVQLQTSYDSKKEGGATVSHLRFGPEKITSEYLISENADFITCTKEPFIRKFDMVRALRKGGIFLQNTSATSVEEVEKKFPSKMLRDLASKHAEFYVIDAQKVAKESGMAKRTNTVMQATFMKLSQVLPGDQAVELLKNDIKNRFKLKGQDIIDKNLYMLENATENLIKIEIPKSWETLEDKPMKDTSSQPDFVKNIMNPVLALRGDDLPVSTFEAGGLFPQDTAQYEKRGIATEIPIWKAQNCTQCNYCSLVCPHSVIRPFLLTRGEKKEAPESFETLKATGGTELAGMEYSIQISSMDCTGCAVCVESCPDDALEMKPSSEIMAEGQQNWDYSMGLPIREEIINSSTVKGSQFLKPYFEFSGACSGCGETPYMKLVSQLFGRRMIIANASGCSSVWGGTATTSPWVVDGDNRGPAWARSLFEDNAEYGLGMFKASEVRKQKLSHDIRKLDSQELNLPVEFTESLHSWLDNQNNVEICDQVYDTVVKYTEGELKDLVRTNPIIRDIDMNKKNIIKESHWIVGGDGWAYDIGFGGLDHILAKGKNVNILIFDTEMYSNTGGQASKATELSTSIKFALMGKRDLKKDLGIMAMSYGNVYVGSVAMGANYNQTLQAMKEAEEYEGTSIILCLSPCIDWGFGDMKYMMDMQKDAVESGYWSLYRYDPRRIEKPLTLDSKKIRKDLMSYLGRQQRFEKLVRLNQSLALNLHSVLKDTLERKHERLLKQSMTDMDLLEHLKKQYGEQLTGEKPSLVLYGSETGTAQNLANQFAEDLVSRGLRAKCMAMDDYDLEELPEEQMVYVIVSTCGDGELPQNCKHFTKELLASELDLSGVQFAVFGLGDTGYEHFNKSAEILDDRLGELGGQRVIKRGDGNDKDDEKFETAWYDWFPQVENIKDLPEAPDVVPVPKYTLNVLAGTTPKEYKPYMPVGTKNVNMDVNRLLSPQGYDRDVRHYEFDTSNKGLFYGSGDCLSIFPKNDKQKVTEFLDEIKLNPNDTVKIKRADNQKLTDLPAEASVHQIFTEVLDIFGRPSRRFYEFLSKYAENPSEKSEIKTILSKDGQGQMLDLINETTTHADLLKRFPSALPSLDYLVQHVAPIKPRLYSIASHPDFVGDSINLCVIADDWTTPSGKFQEGLCSNYLRKLDARNDEITCKLYPSSITIHEDQTPPILMVALGTGIAPMRALVQERKAAKLRGEKIGPMTLLFGSRHSKGDWLYEEEWMQYKEEGILTNVITAFSRDQKEKIYVQHRLDENPDIIHDYLYKNNGYFYLCGIGGPEEAVKVSIRKAIQQGAGLSDADADGFMKRLAGEGRFNFETW